MAASIPFKKKNGSDKPETVEMYIGKTANVLETVTENNGRIAIFGEEWQAKSLNGETVEKGAQAKIVKMTVSSCMLCL